MDQIPDVRIRRCNNVAVRSDGDYVLYWMIAARRVRYNLAFERAVEWAARLGKPLVIFEPLRCDYPYASDRTHVFIMEGMVDNAQALAERGVTYFPYIEQRPGAGKGLLEALARPACLVVTDDAPVFFLPKMVHKAASRLPVLLEAVDSNGLLPLHATSRVFATAASFRRFLQQTLPSHLETWPLLDPLKTDALPRLSSLPATIPERWPVATGDWLVRPWKAVASLPIDHRIPPVPAAHGGAAVARRKLLRFIAEGLMSYESKRNQPEENATSALSPYVHFGHMSSHEIFLAIAGEEGWSVDNLQGKAMGKREGWWGMTPASEAYLDQLVTWRELGFNFAIHRDDGDRYESLPPWARDTLDKHASDPRPQVYNLEQLRDADTHDRLWNAAQMQLVREGTICGYLRMLWGKKILEWSPTPQHAVSTMLELNNTYALDGRDPNSNSGIFWCLGRYDRPFGPERPIFGTVRYMSSTATVRKLHVKEYIRAYAP